MKLSLLGTGLLGASIAQRLQAHQYQIVAYNRTASKMDSLRPLGVDIAPTALDAVQASEGILLTLTDARAIEEILFTGEGNFLSDKTVIQMGTIAPAESIALQKKVYKHGGEYFESPVLGSRPEALDGRLIVMVGGTKEKLDRWMPVLQTLSSSIYHVGEVGKAAALKLALNQLIAAHALSFSASLAMVEKSGIDVNQFKELLSRSALYAPMFDKKLTRWVERNYTDPNFSARHLLKDIDLVIRQAKELEIFTEGIEAAREAVLQVIDKGLAAQDYSCVYEAVREKKQS